MSHPRVLVVTSCTGEKRFKPANQLSLKDFKDPNLLFSRETELAEVKCPAGYMYTGAQHRYTMQGAIALRQAIGDVNVDLSILSAAYGLIPEHKVIAPYEVTFNTMKSYEIEEWARFLKIHSNFEEAIASYNLVFVLLGEKYLRSLQLPVHCSRELTMIFLASGSSSSYIQGLDCQTYVLPLSNSDAKKFGCGLIGLKGFLFLKFAQMVVREPLLVEKIYEKPEYFWAIVKTIPDSI